MLSKEIVKNVKCFLLDLDGTCYLENKLIGNMKNTLNLLRESDKKIVYLTNNSSKSSYEYKEKLKKLEIFEDEDLIYTSGLATIDYLNNNFKGKTVYLAGTDSLNEEFKNNGIKLTLEQPDVVVLSYDITLNYEKLSKITRYITKGSYFIATHPDINCPARDVYLPDIGSFLKLIEVSTNKIPDIICGKPYKTMGDGIKNILNLKEKEIIMVGDRLSTDIKFATNNNFYSLLVLSGETTKDMYLSGKTRANFVLKSLNDIVKYL